MLIISITVTIIKWIGHSLVRPARLFFRLQGVDLSPFMHECPRHFGAHELFLKELGVREEPSAGDYVQFLSDLAQECKGARLNPNELRAVVKIVQAVAMRRKEEVEGSNDNGANTWYSNLYVLFKTYLPTLPPSKFSVFKLKTS